MAMPDETELVQRAALAIAQSKYSGRPNYAVEAQPTHSDARYAAVAVAVVLRSLAEADEVNDEIGAWCEDTAETLERTYR